VAANGSRRGLLYRTLDVRGHESQSGAHRYALAPSLGILRDQLSHGVGWTVARDARVGRHKLDRLNPMRAQRVVVIAFKHERVWHL
jgi:hypothetical protein